MVKVLNCYDLFDVVENGAKHKNGIIHYSRITETLKTCSSHLNS